MTVSLTISRLALLALLWCDLASSFSLVTPATVGPLNSLVVDSRGRPSSLAYSKSQGTCRKSKNNDDDDGMFIEQVDNPGRRNLLINVATGGVLAASGVAAWNFFQLTSYTPAGFRRVPTQFIAALGDPKAKEGTGADEWGLWRLDPGPRGVWLKDYQREIVETNGVAPRGWKFDQNDWWVEEHGLIMESPKFPLAPGRYLVTGARSVTTGLTVSSDGQWKLDQGTLYDVTHLPCRSARYKPNTAEGAQQGGSPANARLSDFPVKPGAIMPTVPGTDKQDYAVLFLVGKAE